MENLVELLKLALSFYANPENYNHPELIDVGLVQSDGGNQARFALESIDKYYAIRDYDDIMHEEALYSDDDIKEYESIVKLLKEIKKEEND